MPLAMLAAMRSDVKLPGPAPHTTRATSRGTAPASASTASTAGISRSSDSPRIAATRSAMTAPSRSTATVPTYVHASSASVSPDTSTT